MKQTENSVMLFQMCVYECLCVQHLCSTEDQVDFEKISKHNAIFWLNKRRITLCYY